MSSNHLTYESLYQEVEGEEVDIAFIEVEDHFGCKFPMWIALNQVYCCPECSTVFQAKINNGIPHIERMKDAVAGVVSSSPVGTALATYKANIILKSYVPLTSNPTEISPPDTLN